jgi:hypothetical protein
MMLEQIFLYQMTLYLSEKNYVRPDIASTNVVRTDQMMLEQML